MTGASPSEPSDDSQSGDDPSGVADAADDAARHAGRPARAAAGPAHRTSLDRRRLLALSGAALAGLAGCGGGDGDGATTPRPSTDDPTVGGPGTSAAPSTTAPTATTTDPTSTGDPTTAGPPSESPSTTDAGTSATPTPEPVAFTTDPVVAPSSVIAPTDGFASADWLAAREPDVVRVTTLDAAGEGSLRAALEAEGHRIVVFEVGGVVDLAGQGGLEIPPGSGSVFVAGQTAPSPGVTVVRGNLVVNGDDVVVQHLRVRSGDEAAEVGDALSVGTEGANVIVDHCTATWGTDEVMSTGGSAANHDVTLSNNVVAEGLRRNSLADGVRGKATLVMDRAKRVAVLGNLYANNVSRHPVLKGGTTSVVANNLVSHYEAAITMAGTETTTSVASVVSNHYTRGPAKRIIERSSPTPPRAYVEDLTRPPGAPVADDSVVLLDEKPVWPGGDLSPIPADGLVAHHTRAAGARPDDRTPHDARVVEDVRTGSGTFVDSQSEVGGYPDLPSTERALDPPAPGEGLADWLVQHSRAVELGESPP